MQNAARAKSVTDEIEHTFGDILSGPDPIYRETRGHMLEN